MDSELVIVAAGEARSIFWLSFRA